MTWEANELVVLLVLVLVLELVLVLMLLPLLLVVLVMKFRTGSASFFKQRSSNRPRSLKPEPPASSLERRAWNPNNQVVSRLGPPASRKSEASGSRFEL